jgi:hypothetical protein
MGLRQMLNIIMAMFSFAAVPSEVFRAAIIQILVILIVTL